MPPPLNRKHVRHVAVSLIAETRSIVPGQPFHLALRQQIEPGWHTYWSNPGDSGLPTTIDWTLPPDFKAGPIVWPTPSRFTVGPVVDYGYQQDILLPVTIDVPARLPPGSNVTISAHASWLVCSDTCIPEDAAGEPLRSGCRDRRARSDVGRCVCDGARRARRRRIRFPPRRPLRMTSSSFMWRPAMRRDFAT